jgi:speckle-type POZ protein
MGNIINFPAETSSSCVMNTATGAHNFRVPSYSLLSGMGVHKYVSSKPFWVGGHKWKIRFYPDGDKATGHARGGFPLSL